MTTKTETKQFQYEIQSYQEDCVTKITSLFESLRQKENFGEVLTAHHKKNKYQLGEHYKDENIKVSFKTRITKTQLATWIKS